MGNIVLVQRAKDGCKASFEELVKMNGEKIYKVAYCYVRNEQMALDVVSEATFKAYRDIKKLKDTNYFDTWLVKIVINEAIDLIRKQKRVIHLEDYNKDLETEIHENIGEKTDLYIALDKLKKY